MALYGVIGDPIAHSMSPLMHTSAFRESGVDATYVKFHVKKEDLPQAIEGIKALGIRGVNVTVPHKEQVMELLDEIDPLAEAIGAVNTIVNENGKLTGYNTDGLGYVEGLRNMSKEPLEGKSMLIIGAGGAAKAIYYTLASLGVRVIDVTNRTKERAEKMIGACPFQLDSTSLTLEEAEKRLQDYDVIIQTTSIGMFPHIDESPLVMHEVKQGSIVSDIIYNPLETSLLKQAREKGAQTQNGLDMFVYQGALSFEKWTGIFPSYSIMKNTVLQQLGG
ncbi:shikimate dehydrogenase [Bacillus sp. KH172YL63]|uniref:shikimate dehydrogenase n=1 Tax=Bacillus sp. KH172YL63 TaxID=2709784 RepID=UPI0013E4A130|nr:shikimate dehydrogenase [Bacillus sp. KH172YL63]BCB04903.1 shikimate dehydrogenase (NADP(+)) [Bacillus sp. KH172YL63]